MSHWTEDLPTPVRPPGPETGNILYPLHPHHGSMNDEERRLDRLNAIRLQETPEDLAWAWAFFRGWYLKQAGRMFYKRFRESPTFHYQIVQDIGRFHRNAIAAPRGFSKSTVLAIEMPLLMSLTRPHFNILLILSTDAMVTKRMRTQYLYQLENNPLIKEDFGEMVPKKGQGSRNVHLIMLANGVCMEAASVRSGLLGPRPDLVLIDDPEIDPKLNKVSPELVDNFDRLLNHHIVPMIDEGGSSLYWLGTLLSKRCFLYYVVTNRIDPRYEFWNRRLLDAEDDGQGNLLWPSKFTRERLERERLEMGDAAYNAQRRNRPGVGSAQVLPMHEKLSCYEVLEPDELYAKNPLASKCMMRGWIGTPENPKPIEREFGPAVARMYRVVLFDWAKCASPTSDFCAAHVIGSEGNGPFGHVWWSLEIQVGRWPGTQWLPILFELACKWKCWYMGIESVAAQVTLVDAAQEYIDRFAMQYEWTPRAVPIKYESRMSKEDRIMALQWRYEQFRIKYPLHRKQEFGYRQLWDQTERFTGEEGCLHKDDAIDTVAMAPYLLKGRRRAHTDDVDGSNRYDALECLKEGRKLPGGVEPGLGIPINEVPADVFNSVMDRYYKGAGKSQERRSEKARVGPWIGS